MLIQPTSFAFTLLLVFLAAMPYSGIDISLPALSATGATLGVSASDVGLTISAFVLSLGMIPLIWGPASDRFGRRPIVQSGTLPSVMNATMAPLPDIAGAVGTTAASIQLTAGAASSGLVSVLFDGRSALSMSVVIALCSLLGLGAYLVITRPAEPSGDLVGSRTVTRTT
jgi:DHA1 family bicyclomycin/chloramphenicol resistance-like MFS transporter